MMQIHQAVIMAGGRGTRLGALSANTPKPLQDVAGKPFLEYVIWNLARQGVTDCILSVGYLSERIIETMGDGSGLGVSIRYVVEDAPLGTGGGAKLAVASVKSSAPWIIVNGDTLYDFPCQQLAEMVADDTVMAAMALRRVDDVERYGAVSLDGNGRVVRFMEKEGQAGNGLINGGVYAVKPAVFDLLPDGASSLERDLFPVLAEKGVLAGREGDGFFLDIGLPETLAAAQTLLPAWQSANR